MCVNAAIYLNLVSDSINISHVLVRMSYTYATLTSVIVIHTLQQEHVVFKVGKVTPFEKCLIRSYRKTQIGSLAAGLANKSRSQ